MTDIPDARLRELAAELVDETGEKVMGKQTLYRIVTELLAAREALAARSVPEGVVTLLEDVDTVLRFYDKQNNGDLLDRIASYRATLAASPPGADNAQVAPAAHIAAGKMVATGNYPEIPDSSKSMAPAEPAEGEAAAARDAEWRKAIRGLCVALGADAHPWAGDKDGWGFNFEFIKSLHARAEAAETALRSPDREAATREAVIGYVTEAARDAMLAAKPGWHYHMFAKDQSDPKATVALRALTQQAKPQQDKI